MNKKITLLSFAWMFGIVLFHACNGNSPRGYAELMSDFRIGGVSFFYIVSGFFLMKHFDEITGGGDFIGGKERLSNACVVWEFPTFYGVHWD